MSGGMFSERQRRFLAEARIGRLATVMPDGGPHIAPVWYRFEDGAFVVEMERRSRKFRNIERDARVAFCVDDDAVPYHTVLVRGRAVVQGAPSREWSEALAVHYLGEEAGRRYIAENAYENDVLVRIVAERVSGW